MKKMIASAISALLMTNAFAGDFAHLKMKISDTANHNKYYLCLYGIGCLNIQSGRAGKVFPISPINVGNIQRFVITDVSNMGVSTQPTHPSCQVTLASNQTLTIYGQLLIKKNRPFINNLRCIVS